jgi:hypothetical protein
MEPLHQIAQIFDSDALLCHFVFNRKAAKAQRRKTLKRGSAPKIV